MPTITNLATGVSWEVSEKIAAKKVASGEFELVSEADATQEVVAEVENPEGSGGAEGGGEQSQATSPSQTQTPTSQTNSTPAPGTPPTQEQKPKQ